MALSANTLRGLTRYLPGTSRQGAAVPRLVVFPDDLTPVYAPLYVRPGAEPSGTAAKGDLYFDSTANALMQHTGSAWEQVGASPTAGLAVTTADTLTVAGVIVPTIMQIACRIGPHATVTEYDLFVAPRALTVTRIDVVPSALQGGALTATIVKAVSTDTPVKTTTPMHTADSINLNSGAYTVQNVTLTVTAADLTLAAGNRIAIDYSAALTAGHAAITISYKYV